MDLTYYILHITSFIFGLIVGSFLNCVIFWLEQGRATLKGRSFCPKCKHALTWRDLIPVFSFIALRGRCRYCHKRISWQYPAVEIATGAVFLLISNFQFPISNLAWRLPVGQIGQTGFQFLNVLCLWAIMSCLIVIFVYDLKQYIISDKVLIFALLLVSVFRALFLFENWKLFGNWKLVIGNFFVSFLLPAIIAAGFFFCLWAMSRGRWMGFGDVKLVFPLSLMLGWPLGLVGLFVAFLGGSIIGAGLIVLGKKKLKSRVPFGPFLIAGSFIALLWGSQIWAWYMTILN